MYKINFRGIIKNIRACALILILSVLVLAKIDLVKANNQSSKWYTEDGSCNQCGDSGTLKGTWEVKPTTTVKGQFFVYCTCTVHAGCRGNYQNGWETSQADTNVGYGYSSICGQWGRGIYTVVPTQITLDNQYATTPGASKIYGQYNVGFYSTYSKKEHGKSSKIYEYIYNNGNKVANVTVPSRTGYSFGGYFTGTNGSGTKCINVNGKIASSNTQFTKDSTLYAYWIPNTYYIDYYGNGSTFGSMDSSPIQFGISKALMPNLFGRVFSITYNANGGTVYGQKTYQETATSTFIGWNTSPFGNGISYANKDTLLIQTPPASNHIPLYAQWSDKVKQMPHADLPENELLGWSTDPNATVATWNEGQNYLVQQNVTLYAKWNKPEVKVYPTNGLDYKDTIHAKDWYKDSVSITVEGKDNFSTILNTRLSYIDNSSTKWDIRPVPCFSRSYGINDTNAENGLYVVGKCQTVAGGIAANSITCYIDAISPTISLGNNADIQDTPDGTVFESYRTGCDMVFQGNDGESGLRSLDLQVKNENTGGVETYKGDSNGKCIYKTESEGNYSARVTVTDNVGHSTTRNIRFSVSNLSLEAYAQKINGKTTNDQNPLVYYKYGDMQCWIHAKVTGSVTKITYIPDSQWANFGVMIPDKIVTDKTGDIYEDVALFNLPMGPECGVGSLYANLFDQAESNSITVTAYDAFGNTRTQKLYIHPENLKVKFKSRIIYQSGMHQNK
jgi:hypothetical protein